MNQIDIKIILLGDSGVGKTSLLNRYINNQFETTKATIGAFFLLKVWRGYNLGIWDTAGQEKYNALGGFYCRNTKAAILMYDITAEDTFRKIQKYLDLLEAENSGNEVFLVLVGSKLDLVQSESKARQVSQAAAQQYATQIKAEWFETSAKTGVQVEDVFNRIGVHFFGETSRPTFSDMRKSHSDRKALPTSPHQSPSHSPPHSPQSRTGSQIDLNTTKNNNTLMIQDQMNSPSYSPQGNKCCQ